jgi:hypothetical protein
LFQYIITTNVANELAVVRYVFGQVIAFYERFVIFQYEDEAPFRNFIARRINRSYTDLAVIASLFHGEVVDVT